MDGFPATRVERELGSRDGRAAPGANGSVGLEVRSACRILFPSGEQFVEKSHECSLNVGREGLRHIATVPHRTGEPARGADYLTPFLGAWPPHPHPTSTPGRNCGDVFTAETAEDAEMKRWLETGLRRLVNELPE